MLDISFLARQEAHCPISRRQSTLNPRAGRCACPFRCSTASCKQNRPARSRRRFLFCSAAMRLRPSTQFPPDRPRRSALIKKGYIMPTQRLLFLFLFWTTHGTLFYQFWCAWFGKVELYSLPCSLRKRGQSMPTHTQSYLLQEASATTQYLLAPYCMIRWALSPWFAGALALPSPPPRD